VGIGGSHNWSDSSTFGPIRPGMVLQRFLPAASQPIAELPVKLNMKLRLSAVSAYADRHRRRIQVPIPGRLASEMEFQGCGYPARMFAPSGIQVALLGHT
jgi:hypothetical protein